MTVAADVALIKSHVDNQVTIQNSRATGAISDAQAFLQALTNAALYAPNFIQNVELGNVLLNSQLLSASPPAKPTNNINIIKKSIPFQPGNFEATVTNRAIQSAPQEEFTVPDITFPTAPVFNKETKPSSPNIALPSGVPNRPSTTVPANLTVSTQTVPNIPSISLPVWGETIPALSIDLPQTTFAYVEPVYTSALKTLVNSKLINNVTNGGTGLGATIEANIWDRQVDRLRQDLDDTVDKTMALFAGRGFPLPTGVLAAQVQEHQRDFTNQRAQASRDVAIEQANIANENTKFWLTTGLSLEELEISHANNIANRALEAEKSVVEFSIALFNAKVQKFNSQLARYQAKAIETENRIRIENLKLEQYRAELQGAETKATKDRVSIENYKAKLDAHNAVVRLYEAEVNATATAINIERGKIEIFKAEIDAYIANINAQRNEYDLFLAQIQGENSKIDLHKTEVEAYATRVNAVKISNDVVIEQIKSDISKKELNLRAHLANVDIWKEKSQLAIQELGIERDFYNTDIVNYQNELKKEIAQAELNLQTLSRGIDHEQKNAEIQLQTAIANVNMLIEQSKTRIAAAKGASDGYVALASVAAGVIQTMLQLGGQGTSQETTTAVASP